MVAWHFGVFSRLDPIHVCQCSVWIPKTHIQKLVLMPWGSSSHKQCSVSVGGLCYQMNVNVTPWCAAHLSSTRMIYQCMKCLLIYGKTISHLLAKLYIASFLSWKDKCLSAGVFPNDLAAGCKGKGNDWYGISIIISFKSYWKVSKHKRIRP